MFDIFKKKSTSEKTAAENREFEINLIGSVLAYEVARADGAVSQDELRNLVKDNFSKDEKLDLIKYLWEIAYADNVLDVNEERLIRRISDLIYIKDIEVLRLKDRARN